MRVIIVMALLVAFAVPSSARHSVHYPYQGGHYYGGTGSSHRYGVYSNLRTGNRYTKHTVWALPGPIPKRLWLRTR